MLAEEESKHTKTSRARRGMGAPTGTLEERESYCCFLCGASDANDATIKVGQRSELAIAPQSYLASDSSQHDAISAIETLKILFFILSHILVFTGTVFVIELSKSSGVKTRAFLPPKSQ